MRRYFFIGGAVGFLLLFMVSFSSGAEIHVVLRNSMIGCIFFALLARFYMQRVASLYMEAQLRRIHKLREEERRRVREQERGGS